MDELKGRFKHIFFSQRAGVSGAIIFACIILCFCASSFGKTNPAKQTRQDASSKSLPIADSLPAHLEADKVIVWKQGKTYKWLLMQGGVKFSIGSYAFAGDSAAVRIDSFAVGGKKGHKIWVYFKNVRPVAGKSGIDARAPRLLIAATTTGKISLEANSFQRSSLAPNNSLVQDAQSLIASRSNVSPASVAQPRQDKQDKTKLVSVSASKSSKSATSSEQRRKGNKKIAPNKQQQITNVSLGKPILPDKGTVHFGFDRIVVKKLQKKTAVMLIGNVRVIYQGEDDSPAISLKSDKAVIFLKNSGNGKNAALSGDKGADAAQNLMQNSIGASAVKGIYLEGHCVVSNGKFTMRSPRVYYNLKLNKAILLNSVFYTYNVEMRIPLYIRAQMIRQISAGSFVAKGASFSSSAFATPFMAIHADSIKLTSKKKSSGFTEHHFTAKNITMNVEGYPTLVWPKLSGSDAPGAPLMAVTAKRSSKDGTEFETKWDLFSLAGVQVPDGVNLSGNLDYRGFHGAGAGVNLSYKRPNMHGNFRGYILPYDTATDKIANRDDVGHDGDLRGFFHFQHRQDLANGWKLSLEAADVSDPTFLEKFFENQAYATRPYETSLYLRKQRNDWSIGLLAKGRLSKFLPQTNLLQSRGFTVDKMPQLTYRRTGTSLFDGLFVWFSDNSASRLRARFDKLTPADRGFNAAQSYRLFGIAPNTSFAQAAAGANYPTQWYARLDSRQELDMPMKVGFIDVTPYVAGRITAYDDDFKYYNGGNSQNIRLWGQGGVRLHTQFNRIYNINSTLLGLHKLRHIIEPSIDMFASGTTLSGDDLPIYDPDVEGISTGTGIKIGMTNTFQTQRGGPGRWHNVDWLSLKTYLVLYNHTNDADAPFPHYFSYRPEYSIGGNHFYTQVKWMASDSLGFTGEITDSLETNKIVQWRVSATMDHTPNLASFVSYEQLEPLDSHILSYGFGYQLTPKYHLGVSQYIDLYHSDTQRVDAWLQRDFAQFKLRLVGSFDSLEGDTSFGVEIMPKGMTISHLIPDIFTQHAGW